MNSNLLKPLSRIGLDERPSRKCLVLTQDVVEQWKLLKFELDRVIPMIDGINIPLVDGESMNATSDRILFRRRALNSDITTSFELIGNAIIAFQRDSLHDEHGVNINYHDLNKKEVEADMKGMLIRALNKLKDFCEQQERDADKVEKMIFDLRESLRGFLSLIAI